MEDRLNSLYYTELKLSFVKIGGYDIHVLSKSLMRANGLDSARLPGHQHKQIFCQLYWQVICINIK